MGGTGSGTPKAELLRLDGTQIEKDGSVSKTDFFKFLELPIEHAANLEKVMTPAQALKFRNHLVRIKTGVSAAMPYMCGGPKCPNKQCPFHETKTWPLSENCPIESTLIAMWMKSYVDDLGVDPENRSSMVLINKLIECDIIDYRANLGLSINEEAWSLLKTTVVDTGKVTMENQDVHPILLVKEITNRMRQQALEALAATPKEKYKRAAALKRRDDETIGDHFTKLKATIAASQRNKVPSVSTIKADAASLEEEYNGNKATDADWEDISGPD